MQRRVKSTLLNATERQTYLQQFKFRKNNKYDYFFVSCSFYLFNKASDSEHLAEKINL